MPSQWILRVRRQRARPNAGGPTLFGNVTYDGGVDGVLRYLIHGQYPGFQGEEAWFRIRWFSARCLEVLEQVAD